MHGSWLKEQIKEEILRKARLGIPNEARKEHYLNDEIRAARKQIEWTKK
jgi:hypothetical protein